MPWSLDLDGGDRLGGGDAELDRLAGAVLDGVGEEVGDHLVEAQAIPAAQIGLRSRTSGPVTITDSEQPARGEIVLEALGRRLHDCGQIDVLEAELQPAGGGAADVEQRVDQRGRADRPGLIDAAATRAVSLSASSVLGSPCRRCAGCRSTLSCKLVSGVLSSWVAIERNSSRSLTAALRLVVEARVLDARSRRGGRAPP